MKKSILILSLVSLFACQPKVDFKPNILWIVCEDISPFLGCYGDAGATTPYLDQLAMEGLRFTNFYANAPVCAPARFSILHGVHASSAGTMNMRSQYRVPVAWETYPELLRKAGYYCTNNAKTDYNFRGDWKVWDESSGKAHYKNRKDGQPFFAVFNLGISHESKIHKYEAVDLKHHPDSMVLPAYVPDNRFMREDMAKLYDNISQMDSQAGDLLKELEEAGLRDSTIVFYYSDHGGVFPRSKRYIHRTGTWVPLITRVPSGLVGLWAGKARGVEKSLTSFVDLAPTVLSLAGLEAPENMEGKAFAGTYKMDPQEEIFLFRNRMDERIDFQRAITDGRYRYHVNYMPHRPQGQYLDYLWRAASVQSWDQAYQNEELNATQSAYWESKPIEELYDMLADPWEVNNLAQNQDFQSVLIDMRAQLKERMLSLHDTGFLPEGRLKEIDQEMPVYAYVRDGDYPLESLLALMEARLDSTEVGIETVRKGLTGSDPLLAYWSASICINNLDLARALSNELIKLLNQDSDENKLVAAEALYTHGLPVDVAAILAEILQKEEEWLLVHALNFVEYMAEKDQQVLLPYIEPLTKFEGNKYVVRAAERILIH